MSLAFCRFECLCRLIIDLCPYRPHGRHMNIADSCAALMRYEEHARVLIRCDCSSIYSVDTRAMQKQAKDYSATGENR